MVLPFADDNPTQRTAFVTVILITVCIGTYVFVQPDPFTTMGTGDQIEFNFERAAIPCELLSGEPLSRDEVELTLLRGNSSACGVERAGSPPVFPSKNVWLSALVSMFLHGSLLHLGGNMLFLWVFGNNIEDHLGPIRYLIFYLAAGIAATMVHVLANTDSTVPVIGASGAVAGVMGAYLIWFPEASIRTLIVVFPIRLPAAAVLLVWFLTQFYVDPSSGVASLAHVGGFIFGAGVGLIVRRSRATRAMLWRNAYGGDAGSWDNRSGPRAW